MGRRRDALRQVCPDMEVRPRARFSTEPDAGLRERLRHFWYFQTAVESATLRSDGPGSTTAIDGSQGKGDLDVIRDQNRGLEDLSPNDRMASCAGSNAMLHAWTVNGHSGIRLLPGAPGL